MATIINNPSGNTGEDSSVGVVVGIFIALILIVLFVMFVWPSLRQGDALPNNPSDATTNINVSLPTGGDTSGGGTLTP